MGAWGFGGFDSDGALDWLAVYILSPVEQQIHGLIDKINASRNPVSWFADELRAAAEAAIRMADADMPLSAEDLPDPYRALADTLERLKEETSWIEGWSDPRALRDAIDAQIEKLKRHSL